MFVSFFKKTIHFLARFISFIDVLYENKNILSIATNIELEKLWDDIDAGKFGEAAKTGQFYTYVKSIKEKHPKP